MDIYEKMRHAFDTGAPTEEIKALVKQGGEETMLQCRRNSWPQVDALIDAGWRFEAVTEHSEPWQWYWRRPPRRRNSRGMLFLSTSQAFNALSREAGSAAYMKARGFKGVA